MCDNCDALVIGPTYDQAGHSQDLVELAYTYNTVAITCFADMRHVDRPDILAAYLIGGLAAVVAIRGLQR